MYYELITYTAGGEEGAKVKEGEHMEEMVADVVGVFLCYYSVCVCVCVCASM